MSGRMNEQQHKSYAINCQAGGPERPFLGAPLTQIAPMGIKVRNSKAILVPYE